MYLITLILLFNLKYINLKFFGLAKDSILINSMHRYYSDNRDSYIKFAKFNSKFTSDKITLFCSISVSFAHCYVEMCFCVHCLISSRINYCTKIVKFLTHNLFYISLLIREAIIQLFHDEAYCFFCRTIEIIKFLH